MTRSPALRVALGPVLLAAVLLWLGLRVAATARAQPEIQGETQIQLVLLSDVEARAQPDALADPVATLHEGEVVLLLSTASDREGTIWYLVTAVEETAVGWIPQSAARVAGVSLPQAAAASAPTPDMVGAVATAEAVESTALPTADVATISITLLPTSTPSAIP
jgi:hypothetical protein